MRYTIVTGHHPGYTSYGYAHYYFPGHTHPATIPGLWQAPYMTPGPHGFHHVYYFRK